MKSLAKVAFANVLVLLGLLLLLEAIGQVLAFARPSYDVLFLEPDEHVGWKHVPGLRWRWAGQYWYAADFSVDVEINSLGFRDLPRSRSRPEGLRRVALLGDSYIEAAQVPLADTAGQLLESKLNAALGRTRRERWEVLNFGVSNYGVGQYLLAWEHYAEGFHPEYVAIFVAGLHLRRTVERYEYGAFAETEQQRLWVRPTFALAGDALVREPARDYSKFVKAQETVIRSEFAGGRVRRKRPRLLTLYYARLILEDPRRLARRLGWATGQPETPPRHDPAEDEVVAVNLKIIEELERQVRGAGGKLVVLDASRYFGDEPALADTLSDFCAKKSIGYVPLYADLSRANRDGVSTRWRHDGHFNRTGNVILADSLFDWIARN